MRFDLLIRGAQIATPSGIETGDVGVRDGKIVAIGDLPGTSGELEVNARNLVLLPGAIDTQVHFREPGLEHKEDLESGTRAAIHGGVTSILEMPNTQPTTTTAEALHDKLRRAEGRTWCNYGFFVGASMDNLEQLANLELLPGTPGIKIFMGSSTGSLLVDGEEALRTALRNGQFRVAVHAEDEARNRERKALVSAHPTAAEHPFLRDSESALIATQRLLRLSEETGRPVHVLHISTTEEPAVIADAKVRGVGVTAEITPQHLWFACPECYERLGSLVQMNPPIRSDRDRDALWQALEAGVFDVFGSDHAPHTLEEKAKPYPQSPSGMPGVQTLLPTLLTFVSQQRLALSTVVRMLCERPASLYGMRGKGRIELGYDADLVLVDLNASWKFERSEVQSKCGWSPYEGEQLTGRVEHVFLGGKPVIRERERVGVPGGTTLSFDKELRK